MTTKNDNRAPRCPKCNEWMRPVENAPRFAQFLPSWSFKCQPCGVALTYHGDADEGETS